MKEKQMTYADLVEEIRQRSPEEKDDLEQLLHQMRIEERRDEILKNIEAGRKEYQRGKLKFSSDVDELKRMLGE